MLRDIRHEGDAHGEFKGRYCRERILIRGKPQDPVADRKHAE